MYSRYFLNFVLLITPILGFSQNNSYSPSQPLTTKDSTNKKSYSINRKIFIGGGIGYSLIMDRIYGYPEGNALSQSIVYNGTIDYGFKNNATLGIGIAYQIASGITDHNANACVKDITRLNIAVRYLRYLISTRHIEIYYGLRVGFSIWTDNVIKSGTPPPYPLPTLGDPTTIDPSLQVPIGIRFLIGPIGIHLEAAIGAPYFAEGGATVRI
jgi:hypothetical protein